MGGISSCCAAETAESKEAITAENASTREPEKGLGAEDQAAAVPRPPPATMPSISEKELDVFQNRLEKSMAVVVLLADATRLACDLKLIPSTKTLVISCDANVREIPLHELKATLHGKDQLKRVETKAPLTEDLNCLALHMHTGNCIPIRFESEKDKDTFIQLIERLKT